MPDLSSAHCSGFIHFSGQKFKNFSRTFQDPTVKFQGLFLVIIYHTPSKYMCQSNESALGTKTSICAFCEHFEDVILWLPEHLFSLAFSYFKTLTYWYFSIFFNKTSRTFKNQNQFQVLSRPWNRTSEIQGFSRHIRTLIAVCKWNVS